MQWARLVCVVALIGSGGDASSSEPTRTDAVEKTAVVAVEFDRRFELQIGRVFRFDDGLEVRFLGLEQKAPPGKADGPFELAARLLLAKGSAREPVLVPVGRRFYESGEVRLEASHDWRSYVIVLSGSHRSSGFELFAEVARQPAPPSK